MNEDTEKIKKYQEMLCEKYPDALDRVKQYRTAMKKGTLSLNKEQAKELQDVYLAAFHLGLKRITKEDAKLDLMARLTLKPTLLEELAERFVSNDLVD